MDADTWGRPDAVLRRAREALDDDRQAVLVTLVDVEGSAYRRPGAKRLLEPGGEDAGTVVPGCLDSRLDRLAESVLENGDPTTATFDLREDDTWGLGVGCDGVVTLLVEPLGADLEPALDALADGQTTAVATVLDHETSGVTAGDRAVFGASSSAVESDWPPWLTERVSKILTAADTHATGTVTVAGPEGDVEVVVDWFEPPPRLVVFGTGPDVAPLVEAGRLAGFRPTVVGFRQSRTREGRFPDASTVVSIRPAEIGETVDFDADTAAVVATHNFVDDSLAVEQLLETPAPYVGVVGSRERFERLVDSLDSDLSTVDRDRLYGPAGLDLGGEAPEQIALSVVTEALAVCNDRVPDHLRERTGPIHDRPAPGS
jgi:xanthine dehydrogenase accessory factor